MILIMTTRASTRWSKRLAIIIPDCELLPRACRSKYRPSSSPALQYLPPLCFASWITMNVRSADHASKGAVSDAVFSSVATCVGDFDHRHSAGRDYHLRVSRPDQGHSRLPDGGGCGGAGAGFLFVPVGQFGRAELADQHTASLYRIRLDCSFRRRDPPGPGAARA